MAFVQRPAGATVEELLDELEIRAGTFHPRLYELLQTECIHVSGHRKTRTGRSARVYKLTKGATFARYIELRGLARSPKTSQHDLTDVERVVLAAGMETLTAWRGGDRRRKNAIIKFVDCLNKTSKLKLQPKTKTVKLSKKDAKKS